jgi:predicted glycosyltransferase
MRRAARLERLGYVTVVPAGALTAERLVEAVARAAPPPRVGLDLGGRERSAALIGDLVARRRSLVP